MDSDIYGIFGLKKVHFEIYGIPYMSATTVVPFAFFHSRNFHLHIRQNPYMSKFSEISSFSNLHICQNPYMSKSTVLESLPVCDLTEEESMALHYVDFIRYIS